MKKLFLLLKPVFKSASILSQNITTTLGTGGLFTIKDTSATFLSLSQSNDYLTFFKSLTFNGNTR